MIYAFIWFACAIIGAIIGSKKGEAFFGFVVSLIFGPLGVLFAVMSSGNRRECPYCKEMIHREATVCPRCQKDVEALPHRTGFLSSQRGR